MSEIRQRSPLNTTNNLSSTHPHISQPAQPGNALAASYLLKSSPTHHGQVMKLNVPLLYAMAPTWLQRILRTCPSPFRPSWKKRYMIQIGKYIYRYQINGSTSHQSKMKLKGTPISIDTVQSKPLHLTTYGLQTVNNQEIIAFAQDLPSSCSGYFSITTSGETRYYAVSSTEDANTWINSLRQGRQSNIELTLGHDKRPYPESWRYIDAIGEQRVNKNGRIKEIMKGSERKEMEMMEFMDGGATNRFS